MIDETDKAFLRQWFATRFGDALFPAPLKETPYHTSDSGIPPAMQVGTPLADGWGYWRPLPSTLPEQAIDAVEQEVSVPFPPLFRAYLASRFVLSYTLQGDGFQIQMPALASDDPLGAIQQILANWEPLLPAGYLPFADYGDGYGPVCFDTAQRTADGDCPIVWMDHEDLLNLDGTPTRENLQPLARPLFASFRAFLTNLSLSGKPV